MPTDYSPSSLDIEVIAGSATDPNGMSNETTSISIEYRPHQVAESDLLIWWKLDNNISDASGNGNDGSISSADWNNSGKFDSCLSLDATDGRSVIHSGLSADLASATLSLWVFPKSENFHLFQSDGLSSDLDVGKKKACI